MKGPFVHPCSFRKILFDGVAVSYVAKAACKKTRSSHSVACPSGTGSDNTQISLRHSPCFEAQNPGQALIEFVDPEGSEAQCHV